MAAPLVRSIGAACLLSKLFSITNFLVMH
jgi:hypothetical protein